MIHRRTSTSLLAILALLAIGATGPAIAQSSSTSAPAQDNKPTASQPTSQAASQPASQAAAQPAAQTDEAAQPQSLADAARANQKDKPKAKKVYTADDLASLHGTISVVGDHSKGSGGDANDSGSPASAGANSEQYWHSRAETIKQQIADTDRQIDSVKAEIAKQGAASFDPSTGLSQGVIIVHDRNAEVKQLEDRKASLEHQLDDLADEARKAGADPGWAR